MTDAQLMKASGVLHVISWAVQAGDASCGSRSLMEIRTSGKQHDGSMLTRQSRFPGRRGDNRVDQLKVDRIAHGAMDGDERRYCFGCLRLSASWGQPIGQSAARCTESPRSAAALGLTLQMESLS